MIFRKLRVSTKILLCSGVSLLVILSGIYLTKMYINKETNIRINSAPYQPSRIPTVIKDNIKNKNNYNLRVNIAEQLFTFVAMDTYPKNCTEKGKYQLANKVSKYVDSLPDKTLDSFGSDDIIMTTIPPNSKVIGKNEITLNFDNLSYLVTKDNENIF